MSIIIAFLVFGLIVLVHEFGHFFAAKKCGVLVEEFAIGMGPKVIGIQKGETLYSIRALPLGGYCKMMGESEESDDPRAFINKKVSQRIIIIISGVLMNFLLAFILQFVVTLFTPMYTTTIGETMDNFPAKEIGIEVGDTILSFNDKKVKFYDDLKIEISMINKFKETEITYLKPSGEIVSTRITAIPDEEGNALIGIKPAIKSTVFMDKFYSSEELSEMGTLIRGEADTLEYFTYTGEQVKFYIGMVYTGLKQLVMRQLTADDFMGPVGVFGIIGDTYESSVKFGFISVLVSLLSLTVLLSANLGVMNILPLPALDGGRLIFLILEALRGKPIDQEKEGMVHFVGMVAFMLFAVFITYKDIVRLIAN